jgi:predicted dienelactone hydrolase
MSEFRNVGRWLGRVVVAAAIGFQAAVAAATVGLDQIAGQAGDGPVTLFYPSSSEVKPVQRGPFTFDVAWQGAPERGNGRLVVVSHGSGGSPWVYADLARTLVEAGFVVALPEHRADNYKDPSAPGPESWKRRPAEVSRAIDAVALDPRFAPLLQTDRVGVYGMSAGGHTALELAGGLWSPSRFKQHCEAHIDDDFPFCVGLATRLRGDVFDSLKKRVAMFVIRGRFEDETPQTYVDPRIAAAVAGVPAAADFEMSSLATPRIPLGLVTAGHDKWLAPRFHSDAVLAACSTCELVAAMPDGGHGALLSPFPPALPEIAAELLNDPAGFDRSVLRDVDARISAFFRRHLMNS